MFRDLMKPYSIPIRILSKLTCALVLFGALSAHANPMKDTEGELKNIEKIKKDVDRKLDLKDESQI